MIIVKYFKNHFNKNKELDPMYGREDLRDYCLLCGDAGHGTAEMYPILGKQTLGTGEVSVEAARKTEGGWG